MRTAAVILLLCTAAVVHAHDAMPILSAATVHRPTITGPTRRLHAAPATQALSRKMLGMDFNPASTTTDNFPSVYTGTGGVCSSGDNSAYAQLTGWDGYGEIVVNRGLCALTGGVDLGTVTTGAGNVAIGAAAQDFGAGYTNWETYGWALFQVPTKTGQPDPAMGVKIEGINIHVIGAVGLGSDASAGSPCSVSAASVAIFDAGAGPTYTPSTTPIHMVKVGLPGSQGTTFQWSSNTSDVLYTDIVDFGGSGGPTVLNLTTGNYYWLRVKLFADYAGASGNGKCFVFWGMSSTTDIAKARWQESVGGALGYSTKCLGASGSGTTDFPDNTQTFYNCFNGGAPATGDTTLKRRCLSYRTSIVPNLAATDCPGNFNDFNFALYGNTGLAGF